MPYRSLTHGRVNSSITTVASTHRQASAIKSQKGVANNGPPIVQRNKNGNIKTGGSARAIYARTRTINSLMTKSAFGDPATYSAGQGKGFPNALPQTSVGSTNVFARRAIARKAVTQRVGVSESVNCCKTLSPPSK